MQIFERVWLKRSPDEAPEAAGGGGEDPAPEAAGDTKDVTQESEEVEAEAEAEGDELKGDASEGEPEGETPAEPEKPAAPEKTPITTALLGRAFRAGMTEDEISEFEDGAGLERALKMIERRSAPKEDSAAKASEDEKIEEIADLPEEGDDAFDAKITKPWKVMKSRIARLEQRNQELRKLVSERAHQQETDWFDNRLSALGTEGEGLFGKGGYDDLDPKSAQMTNRQKLWEAVGRLRSGYFQRKEALPPRNKLFEQAYRMEFGENIKQAEKAKILAAAHQRSSQFTNRPTNRTTENEMPKGQERAVKAVEKRMAELKRKKGQ